MILRNEYIQDVNENGDLVDIKIPIVLEKDIKGSDECFIISVDGVEWVNIKNNVMHAIVLFEMMKDNLTEYMKYSNLD